MIVLLSGKQGSGKSTIQRMLKLRWIHETRGDAHDINFADVLYQMHDAVLEILHKHIPAREIAKDGPLLQLLGTEWGRNTIDKNVWVEIARRRAELSLKLSNPNFPALVIIGDCRFENEVDAFPDALSVRLEAPPEVRKKRCSAWRENDIHPSEIALDFYVKAGRFDMTIDTSWASPESCVNLIYNKLKERRGRNKTMGPSEAGN